MNAPTAAFLKNIEIEVLQQMIRKAQLPKQENQSAKRVFFEYPLLDPAKAEDESAIRTAFTLLEMQQELASRMVVIPNAVAVGGGSPPGGTQSNLKDGSDA